MAKLAFWITAGPTMVDKVLANLVLATRLKANREQDVEVYFFGPGVDLAGHAQGQFAEALQALMNTAVPVGVCPANATQYEVTAVLTEQGVKMEPAGEALVRLVEAGYQIVGV